MYVLKCAGISSTRSLRVQRGCYHRYKVIVAAAHQQLAEQSQKENLHVASPQARQTARVARVRLTTICTWLAPGHLLPKLVLREQSIRSMIGDC